jgi:hypothetical protein
VRGRVEGLGAAQKDLRSRFVSGVNVGTAISGNADFGFTQRQLEVLLSPYDDEPLDAHLIWLGDATKYEAIGLSNQRVERTSKKRRRANSDRRHTRRSRA